jgi:hypothetical protein
MEATMSETRWKDAARALLEKTAQGELHWQPLTGKFSRDDMVGAPFACQASDGTRLALYEYRGAFFGVTMHTPQMFSYGARIEFVDEEGRMLLAWPTSDLGDVARDLLTLVRQKSSGAEEFLDRLLSSGDKKT